MHHGVLFLDELPKLIQIMKERGEVSKQEYLRMWPVSLSAIDQDVKDLKDLGVLKGEKRGNWAYYRFHFEDDL